MKHVNPLLWVGKDFLSPHRGKLVLESINRRSYRGIFNQPPHDERRLSTNEAPDAMHPIALLEDDGTYGTDHGEGKDDEQVN
jgi:hypothetical protein